MRYRFNHRFLNQGRQGYDPENNAYFKKTNAKDGSKIANMLNQNRHNVTTGSNGGYVNYLRHGLPDGKYQLVFNTVPFGVGNVMQMILLKTFTLRPQHHVKERYC